MDFAGCLFAGALFVVEAATVQFAVPLDIFVLRHREGGVGDVFLEYVELCACNSQIAVRK